MDEYQLLLSFKEEEEEKSREKEVEAIHEKGQKRPEAPDLMWRPFGTITKNEAEEREEGER